MTQYKSAIPIVGKEFNIGVTQHKWSKIVKDFLTQKIKYAHNSIRNPQYPVKQQNQPVPQSDRVKFTVIGDRVTKEFIYCCNLVKGLHKYRSKIFDVPTIKGVTTVEWPQVWNDLKISFGTVAECLLTSVAVFRNDKIIGGEKELKQLVEKQYVYHLCLDYYKEGVAEFSRYIKSSGRPTAYMHVSINDTHIGTLIFMLYADIAPYTCENFLRLCKEKRGGYGGTPVHRIVKDGWIQCGGFGLKNTPLSCENFKIPFDRRGVLAMANDGRDRDCSTQFFVLLQPAPWMNHKYVAFGQLIEGAATLEKIESVTTWYESPTSKIILYRCGIFNMECHDIRFNNGTNEYIDRHIEDLTDFSDRLWEHILEQVFLTAQLREIDRMREQGGEENVPEDDAIRPTQRFKKEDIEKQIERNQDERHSTENENIEFDVEEYAYELEEDEYQRQSLHSFSLDVKPQRPYYLPLTDVPYPGDVDSDFDLKRLLQGKYCLKSDLEKDADKVKSSASRFPSELLLNLESEILTSDTEIHEVTDMDEELNVYVKENVEKLCLAGGVVMNIAKKGDISFLNDDNSSLDIRDAKKLINDEKLRKIRLASVDMREQDERLASGRVAIHAPQKWAGKIKRRQTGFVRPKDLENIRIMSDSDQDDDDDSKTVRLNPIDVFEAEKALGQPNHIAKRRPTGFIRPADLAKYTSNSTEDDDDDDNDDDDDEADDDDDELVSYTGNKGPFIQKKPSSKTKKDIFFGDGDRKPSALTRLFNQVAANITERGPTLKNYKPLAEIRQSKNTMLTNSPMIKLHSNESTRTKYKRIVKTQERSAEEILNLRHGQKIARKISPDYVRTIEKSYKIDPSLRSIEYAKTRPTMSVSEYRLKNRKYQEGLRQMSNKVNTVMMPNVDFDMRPSTSDFQHNGHSDLPEVLFPFK